MNSQSYRIVVSKRVAKMCLPYPLLFYPSSLVFVRLLFVHMTTYKTIPALKSQLQHTCVAATDNMLKTSRSTQQKEYLPLYFSRNSMVFDHIGSFFKVSLVEKFIYEENNSCLTLNYINFRNC